MDQKKTSSACPRQKLQRGGVRPRRSMFEKNGIVKNNGQQWINKIEAEAVNVKEKRTFQKSQKAFEHG